ncbi:MAG: hypothetical protein DHS80DRAFT_24807 [Piptocephalis tieghemiana]|nr:MAG: hypothetical protein DHS80DRAFT_24807 [Piptocephalis tieghemiana]
MRPLSFGFSLPLLFLLSLLCSAALGRPFNSNTEIEREHLNAVRHSRWKPPEKLSDPKIQARLRTFWKVQVNPMSRTLFFVARKILGCLQKDGAEKQAKCIVRLYPLLTGGTFRGTRISFLEYLRRVFRVPRQIRLVLNSISRRDSPEEPPSTPNGSSHTLSPQASSNPSKEQIFASKLTELLHSRAVKPRFIEFTRLFFDLHSLLSSTKSIEEKVNDHKLVSKMESIIAGLYGTVYAFYGEVVRKVMYLSSEDTKTPFPLTPQPQEVSLHQLDADHLLKITPLAQSIGNDMETRMDQMDHWISYCILALYPLDHDKVERLFRKQLKEINEPREKLNHARHLARVASSNALKNPEDEASIAVDGGSQRSRAPSTDMTNKQATWGEAILGFFGSVPSFLNPFPKSTTPPTPSSPQSPSSPTVQSPPHALSRSTSSQSKAESITSQVSQGQDSKENISEHQPRKESTKRVTFVLSPQSTSKASQRKSLPSQGSNSDSLSSQASRPPSLSFSRKFDRPVGLFPLSKSSPDVSITPVNVPSNSSQPLLSNEGRRDTVISLLSQISQVPETPSDEGEREGERERGRELVQPD